MVGKTSPPVVTAVITTYKRPELLKTAIQSVLNQTYPYFKICIYDDASGDHTEEVVAETAGNDPRVSYHLNERNLGVVRNFNYGFSRVDTPFFIDLPDDDILLPEHFERALKGFEKYPEAILSVNQTIFVRPDRTIHRINLDNCRGGIYRPPEGLIFLIKNDPTILSGAVYRSEMRKKIGYYDPKLDCLSDADYVFRIAADCPFVVNKTPGVIFRMHESNARLSMQARFLWPKWLKVMEKLLTHPNLSAEAKLEVENHLKKYLRRGLIRQGKDAVYFRQYSEADKAVQVLKDYFKSPRHALKLQLSSFMGRWFPFYCWITKNYKVLRLKKKRMFASPEYKEYYEECQVRMNSLYKYLEIK